MPSVLHLLPHTGGGGERYVDLLESMPGWEHRRDWLSATRSPLTAGPSIVARHPKLWRQARHYDLVHLHGDMASMLAVPLLRRQPGLVSTHGLSFLRRADGVPLRVARARWSQVTRHARRIVCCSHAEREELLALAGDQTAAKLTVAPNGIALPALADSQRRNAARAQLGIDEKEIAGLYLGLLDRYKDPLTAVRAAHEARRHGVRFTLLMAGDGPLLDTVREEAGSAVRVLGFQADPQTLLHAADIFVMPSTREGSSYALLEAMGHGLAIVASDGAGIPELVGDTAITAPVGDAQAFAAGLMELARDPDRRALLGTNARTRVERCFGIERFVDCIRSLYEEVLSE